MSHLPTCKTITQVFYVFTHEHKALFAPKAAFIAFWQPGGRGHRHTETSHYQLNLKVAMVTMLANSCLLTVSHPGGTVYIHSHSAQFY